jgi:hypothetical protein
VVAESAEQAIDATERIVVDIDALPAVSAIFISYQ